MCTAGCTDGLQGHGDAPEPELTPQKYHYHVCLNLDKRIGPARAAEIGEYLTKVEQLPCKATLAPYYSNLVRYCYLPSKKKKPEDLDLKNGFEELGGWTEAELHTESNGGPRNYQAAGLRVQERARLEDKTTKLDVCDWVDLICMQNEELQYFDKFTEFIEGGKFHRQWINMGAQRRRAVWSEAQRFVQGKKEQDKWIDKSDTALELFVNFETEHGCHPCCDGQHVGRMERWSARIPRANGQPHFYGCVCGAFLSGGRGKPEYGGKTIKNGGSNLLIVGPTNSGKSFNGEDTVREVTSAKLRKQYPRKDNKGNTAPPKIRKFTVRKDKKGTPLHVDPMLHGQFAGSTEGSSTYAWYGMRSSDGAVRFLFICSESDFEVLKKYGWDSFKSFLNGKGFMVAVPKTGGGPDSEDFEFDEEGPVLISGPDVPDCGAPKEQDQLGDYGGF